MKKKINLIINIISYSLIILFIVLFIDSVSVPDGGSWEDMTGFAWIILIFLVAIIKFILNKIVNKYLK